MWYKTAMLQSKSRPGTRQTKDTILSGNFLCLSRSSATFALQHGSFVPREWLAALLLLAALFPSLYPLGEKQTKRFSVRTKYFAMSEPETFFPLALGQVLIVNDHVCDSPDLSAWLCSIRVRFQSNVPRKKWANTWNVETSQSLNF